MDDPMRSEEVSVSDGRSVRVRPGTVGDVEAILDNINLVCAEEVYLMMDSVPYDIEREREWLSEFDGERNALFVAVDGPAIVGQVDCHAGEWAKMRHVGGVGIAIRDGWREAGLGRVLMGRILEWMRARHFAKAELRVFATNERARRLYASFGFEVEGVQKRQVRIRDEFIDELIMGLWLGP